MAVISYSVSNRNLSINITESQNDTTPSSVAVTKYRQHALAAMHVTFPGVIARPMYLPFMVYTTKSSYVSARNTTVAWNFKICTARGRKPSGSRVTYTSFIPCKL